MCLLPDLPFVEVFHAGGRWIPTGPLSDDEVASTLDGRGPMEPFHKLFGSLPAFVYHCFDRIVIEGYLPLLTRPEHIVHFFRDVHGIYPVTKETLARRTGDYQRWVEAFARNHRIPIQWPGEEMKKKGIKKERLRAPVPLQYGTSQALRRVLAGDQPSTWTSRCSSIWPGLCCLAARKFPASRSTTPEGCG